MESNDCRPAQPLRRILRHLDRRQGAVHPGGVAAIDVLIEGTTFMGMFTPGDYCLFGEHAREEAFAGRAVEYAKFDTFPAPGDTVKLFCKLVARRPA